MLETILANGRTQIVKIVDHWLAAGARQVSFWSGDEPLAWWPAEGELLSNGDICASLNDGGQRLGRIQIAGLHGAIWSSRLAADAEMIVYAAQLENELDMMTEEMVSQQEQLVGLYQITQETRSKLTIEQIVNSLGVTAAGLVGAEFTFTTYQEERTGTLVDYHPEAPPERKTRLAIEGLVSRNQEILINDGTDEDCPPAVDSFYFTPVQSFESMTLGIGLINKWDGRFQSPDIKLMKALVEHAAAQIENVLLHEEMLAKAKMQTEMNLARTVQLRLLPEAPPTISGIDIFASSEPALEVGGDFFDFIPTGPAAMHFTVGDVAGKGMSAAMLMAMSRTVIRNLVRRDKALTPAKVFDQANSDLYDDFTDVEMFATVFCGHVSAATGRLTFVNAGQSPVIYRPVDGLARYVETDGPAMGVLPMSVVSDSELPFRPGDILIVATDGFSEARDQEGTLFGYERLLELVDELAAESATGMATGMFTAIREYSGTREQDDDQTLIVLKGQAD